MVGMMVRRIVGEFPEKNTAQFSNESILAVIKQRTRHGEEAAV